ncbi:MAG TPA: hypothetical protein VF547_03855 [Allosphingosinicella sp.]
MPPPPHNPLMARCAIRKVADAINARAVDGLIAKAKVYTDLLGEVGPEEEGSFLDLFGKEAELNQQENLRVKDVSLLTTRGLYVAVFDRYHKEAAKRSDRYMKSHWSVWLIAFESNEIVSMRQATELWPFTLQNPAFGSDEVCPMELKGG